MQMVRLAAVRARGKHSPPSLRQGLRIAHQLGDQGLHPTFAGGDSSCGGHASLVWSPSSSSLPSCSRGSLPAGSPRGGKEADQYLPTAASSDLCARTKAVSLLLWSVFCEERHPGAHCRSFGHAAIACECSYPAMIWRVRRELVCLSLCVVCVVSVHVCVDSCALSGICCWPPPLDPVPAPGPTRHSHAVGKTVLSPKHTANDQRSQERVGAIRTASAAPGPAPA